MLAGKPALHSRRARVCPDEIRKPGELVFAVEHKRIELLVRQHVLAEGRAERRQPFIDFGKPRFRGSS